MLLNISHLPQIRLVTPELNIDHCAGIYKINEFCFGDPFVRYGFAFLECDGTLVAVGDAEEGFVNCIVR